MGNIIMWEESPSDSTWTRAEVYRATSESGSYLKIKTLQITDFTYYDPVGLSTSYYKIRFTNNEGSQYTDYSDAIRGANRYLYTDPKDVLRAAGLTTSTLPDSITTNDIYDWIYDVSKNLDQSTKCVYGRTESFEEIHSSKYMNVNQTIMLEHKNVSDLTVSFRTSIAPDESGEYSWTEKNEGYDFQVFPKGKLKLFTWPVVHQPYNFRDIKIEGTYGISTIPTAIEQLTKFISAIRIFVHITGGSYNDVTSWSLGEYSESLGEPYTNLRATIDMLTKEIERVKLQTGITDQMQDVRYA